MCHFNPYSFCSKYIYLYIYLYKVKIYLTEDIYIERENIKVNEIKNVLSEINS